MKRYASALVAAAFLISGIVAAEDDQQKSKPIELSAAQMDGITAGSLLLPNDKVVFGGFDNPAPDTSGYLAGSLGLCDPAAGGDFCHPALNRRSDTAFVTGEHVPSVTGLANDGPWTATVVSPVIVCPDC